MSISACGAAFGKVISSEIIDQTTFDHVLKYNDIEPQRRISHRVYEAPTGWLERWKWLTGLSNSLDRKVQQNYDQAVALLESSQATSILQLKNKLQVFWHLDREIIAYQSFRGCCVDEKTLAIGMGSFSMGAVFFRCIRFFLALFYDSAYPVHPNKNLSERSQETFAQIGSFNLKDKSYNVVAFHHLGDEATSSGYDCGSAEFHSASGGMTRIGIFEKEDLCHYTKVGHISTNHSVGVCIGREFSDSARSGRHEVALEGHALQGVEVQKKRHIVVGDSLEYRDRACEAIGSDRELDQKLTQLMIEVATQNRDILSVRVTSCNNDLPVLIASGFQGYNKKYNLEVKEQLRAFRANTNNRLFPPSEDYGGVNTYFDLEKIGELNVSYGRETEESWADIIAREPILKSGSAILPEYWAVKPKIARD